MHSSQKKVGLDILREKISFQRKTESLDWKKIASINIENLVQEGDTSQLAELISCVTFCKADSEFDHERIDPGFIKVFRISQLISECLLASHEGCKERLTIIEGKYNELEKEKEKLSEENTQLKETLTSAKKELKKRKEMLASSQNEILGPNNADEYDQCPYCTKKFLNSGYLLAHLQRRHQGLPVNPLYPGLSPGGTSAAAAMLYHHQLIQSQTMPNHTPPHQTQNYQQSLGESLESPGYAPQSPHLLINHHQQQSSLPVIHVPGSPMLYGINQLVSGQHNNNTASFSGSVTSLNQMASIQANNNDGNGNFLNKDHGITKNVSSTSLNARDMNDGEEEGESRQRDVAPTPPKLFIELEKKMSDVGIQSEIKAIERVMVAHSPKTESSTQTDLISNNADEDDAEESGEVQNPFVPKGLMEFAKNMATVGLNPESMALQTRLEEMEKTLRNLQAQRTNSSEDHGAKVDEKVSRGNLPKQNSFAKTIVLNIDSEEELEESSEETQQETVKPIPIPKTRKNKTVDTGVNPEFPLVPGMEALERALKSLQLQIQKSQRSEKSDDDIANGNTLPKRNSSSQTIISTKDDDEYEDHSSETQLDAVRPPKTIMVSGRTIRTDIGKIAPKRPPIEVEEVMRTSKNLKPRQRSTPKDQDQSETVNNDDGHTPYRSSPKKKGFARSVSFNKNAEEDAKGDETYVQSDDDISDYSLSESLALTPVNPTDRHRHHYHPSPDHDHSPSPRGKSSLKKSPSPVKKTKYMFDEGARKIISDNDDEERSSNSSQVNNSADNNDSDGDRDKDRKSKKSQMDLVRATMMELENSMADVGLNPERTAIGVEEMGRAMKHIESQRRSSFGDQNDREQFEQERNAVKAFAKFEATKSTIDGKLDAISTLSKDKPQSSFVKMFSAVKVSGKNFRKRVASAVKRQKKEDNSGDSEDEANAGGDAEKKRKRKATSAPVLKTTFFSKARWTKKKKAEGATNSENNTSSKGNSGKNGNKTDSESGSSEEESESGEDIEAPPFMTRSKPVLPRRNSPPRQYSSPRSTKRNSRDRGSSSESMKRSSRSRPNSKLNKPLKRLNTSANSNSSGNSSPSAERSPPRKSVTPRGTKKIDYLNAIDYKKDVDIISNSSDVDNSEEDEEDMNERLQQVLEKKKQLDPKLDHHHRPASRNRKRNSSDTSPFSNVDDEYENATKADKDNFHLHHQEEMDAESDYDSPEEWPLPIVRTPTSKSQHNIHRPVTPPGHFETLQVKPAARARAHPVNDKVDAAAEDSDVDRDVEDLLNVTIDDDDKRLGYHHQQKQPQPTSPYALINSLDRRNVGASMMQPTHHGGIQRSNLTGIPMGRGGLRSTQLTVRNRSDNAAVSPTNSWDSGHSPNPKKQLFF